MSVYKNYIRYPRNENKPKPDSSDFTWGPLTLTNIEKSPRTGSVLLNSVESYKIDNLYDMGRVPPLQECRSFMDNHLSIEHFVFSTKNVKAIMPSGVLIQESNDESPDAVLEASCYMSLGFFHPDLMNDRTTKWQWLLREGTDFEQSPGRIAWCYHRFYNQYFHWFIDCLPRIWLLKKFDFDYDKVFVGDIANIDFALKSLDAFGIDETSIVYFDEGKNLFFDDLILPVTKVTEQRKIRPSLGDGIHFKGGWSKSYIVELNNRIVQKFAKNDAKHLGFDKIFVGRNDASHRRVENIDEVETLLAKYGFVFIDPGTLSFEDQVTIFHCARKIVGIHGAGMTNILWTNIDSTVDIIEIAVDGLDDPGYRMISEALSLNYRAIAGSPVGNHRAGMAFDDLRVNIIELEAELKNINS